MQELVLEKETRIRESMLMMGLKQWVLWGAWYLKQFVFLLISVVFITILMKVCCVSACVKIFTICCALPFCRSAYSPTVTFSCCFSSWCALFSQWYHSASSSGIITRCRGLLCNIISPSLPCPACGSTPLVLGSLSASWPGLSITFLSSSCPWDMMTSLCKCEPLTLSL